MKAGYREQACPACGRRFPTLARAPGVWCSYRCAEIAFRPVAWRRSA